MYVILLETSPKFRLTMKPNSMPAVVADPETGQRAGAEKAGLFRVILLDDDDHSYNYVIEMLQKIFYFSVRQALQHAREVDLTGRTVLITCGRREAEFSRDQIQAWGPDPLIPRCRGSMSALIEPATESPAFLTGRPPERQRPADLMPAGRNGRVSEFVGLRLAPQGWVGIGGRAGPSYSSSMMPMAAAADSSSTLRLISMAWS